MRVTPDSLDLHLTYLVQSLYYEHDKVQQSCQCNCSHDKPAILDTQQDWLSHLQPTARVASTERRNAICDEIKNVDMYGIKKLLGSSWDFGEGSLSPQHAPLKQIIHVSNTLMSCVLCTGASG